MKQVAKKGMQRCPWATLYSGADSAEYIAYHDKHWGRPLIKERELFEMIVLELNQAGLSWATILKKRKNFRKAFEGFEVDTVASWAELRSVEEFRKAKTAALRKKVKVIVKKKHMDRLMADAGIVRNKLKIEAAVQNAVAVKEFIRKEYGARAGLAAYLYGMLPTPEVERLPVIQNAFSHMYQVPAKSKLTDAVAKQLAADGIRFLGSTTIYALFQSCGLINDHLTSCPCREECIKLAKRVGTSKVRGLVKKARDKLRQGGYEAPGAAEGAALPKNVAQRIVGEERLKKRAAKSKSIKI